MMFGDLKGFSWFLTKKMVCYVYWWLHTSELGVLTKRKFWSGKGFQKFLHHGIDIIHGTNTISRKKIQVFRSDNRKE